MLVFISISLYLYLSLSVYVFLFHACMSSLPIYIPVYILINCFVRNLVLDIMLSQLDKASYSKPISQQVRKTVPEDITALTETVPFILKMFKDNACMILGLNQGVSMNNEVVFFRYILIFSDITICCLHLYYLVFSNSRIGIAFF